MERREETHALYDKRRKKMKKTIFLILILILAFGGLTACGATKTKAGEKTHIVVTIAPVYDWVMNVLGDNPGGADVTLLLDKGVDLHSFQPSAADIMKVSSCDLFIYVGGESDVWVDDVLKEAVNKEMTVINLLEDLGDKAKEEELVEGMQGEEEEDEEEEGPEYDEHVWLSLSNAELFVKKIAEAMCALDPADSAYYKEKASAYTTELEALDGEYREAVKNAAVSTLLFGDRFPFRYLTDDYGLSYYAAFIGCSAETEASFETIAFLSKKVDELGLKSVMTIDGSDKKIAETIVKNTKSKDQKVLTLDSMQKLTSKDIKNGKHYISIMRDNLSVLKEALK